MIKIKSLLAVWMVVLYVCSACNNSNTGSNMATPSDTATTVDTVLKSDTVDVSPENFSDPH